MLRHRKRAEAPRSPIAYPPGTFIETEKGFFYITSPSKRLRFSTKRVLDSWNPQHVAKTTETAVRNFRCTAKMRFRNGSLLYSQADGRMYLISDNKRRHITNPDWLEWLGIDRRDAVWVSENEINLHEEGEPLA